MPTESEAQESVRDLLLANKGRIPLEEAKRFASTMDVNGRGSYFLRLKTLEQRLGIVGRLLFLVLKSSKYSKVCSHFSLIFQTVRHSKRFIALARGGTWPKNIICPLLGMRVFTEVIGDHVPVTILTRVCRLSNVNALNLPLHLLSHLIKAVGCMLLLVD